MATTNLYLKDPKGKDETLIYLVFRFNRQKLKYSIREKITPRYWNFDLQRVKRTYPGSPEFNFFLDKVEAEVQKSYRLVKSNGTEPTVEHLRERLNESLFNKAPAQKDILGYLLEFIEIHQGKKTERTLGKYKTLHKRLLQFQEVKKFKLSFDRMNLEFYERFESYLNNDRRVLNNTKAKFFKTLKTFLGWAADRGYHNTFDFKKFKSAERDVDIVTLTYDELQRIYTLDLVKHPRLERVRDVFCFGCFTGLRYSDIARLQKENIHDDEIRKTVRKTKEELIIPLNFFAKEILKKNDLNLSVVSNQKMNDYIKELGKMTGIQEQVIITRYRGVEEIRRKEPKFNLLSTHTARRTFITLSLEKGMRPETVMSISGHKDYQTFKKYIKITDKVKKVEMQRVWGKEVELKVVK